MLSVDVILPPGIYAGCVLTWYVCGSWLKGTKCLCIHSLPNSSTSVTILLRAPYETVFAVPSNGTWVAADTKDGV